MGYIPEIARHEADVFKSQAMALINENHDDIIRTGLLDNSDYLDEDGQPIEDISDAISQELAELLLESSGSISTAFEIDDENNEINGNYSLASPENSRTSYIAFSLYEGEHINGQIILSNTGEAHIVISDKNGKILNTDVEEVAEYHELFLCANHVLGKDSYTKEYREFKSHTIDIEDLSKREINFYLANFDINHFRSEADYADFKINYLHLGGSDESLIENAAKALEADSKINYILLREDDETIGIIAEHNGDIFYSNKNTGDFEIYYEGDEFEILGHEIVAEPRVLEVFNIQIDGQYQTIANFVEVEESKPEVKNKTSYKP